MNWLCNAVEMQQIVFIQYLILTNWCVHVTLPVLLCDFARCIISTGRSQPADFGHKLVLICTWPESREPRVKLQSSYYLQVILMKVFKLESKISLFCCVCLQAINFTQCALNNLICYSFYSVISIYGIYTKLLILLNQMISLLSILASQINKLMYSMCVTISSSVTFTVTCFHQCTLYAWKFTPFTHFKLLQEDITTAIFKSASSCKWKFTHFTQPSFFNWISLQSLCTNKLMYSICMGIYSFYSLYTCSRAIWPQHCRPNKSTILPPHLSKQLPNQRGKYLYNCASGNSQWCLL